MNDDIQTEHSAPLTRKKEIIIGAIIVAAIIGLIVGVTLLINGSGPKIIYQPVVACDALTLPEAQALLGNKTIRTATQDPIVSGDSAVSSCGYADGSANQETALVAAVRIRSGINDKGVEQNKAEFVAGKPSSNVETVQDLGDGAYFNHSLGQLNVLNGRDWLILSYGISSAPEANTVDAAATLARKVIQHL